jgi:hypothetical protein
MFLAQVADAALQVSVRALPGSIRRCAIGADDQTLAALLRRGRELVKGRPSGETVTLTDEQMAALAQAYAILEGVTAGHHADCPCELCQARVGCYVDPADPEFCATPNVWLANAEG